LAAYSKSLVSRAILTPSMQLERLTMASMLRRVELTWNCEVELADLAADMKFIDIEEFVPLSSSDSTMAPINIPFRADPISLRSF
jgi:hypothetical protein